jgi:phosphomannomutase/phosphoglucomutase
MTIYKDCDIRGQYGKELLDEHAEKLGKAIACIKGKVDILVGGDGRLSTPALKSHLINSLAAEGCRVIDLGQVPTPVFYFARNYLGIENGVMVTASHNPAQDNGFKIILGKYPITLADMNEISEIMENIPRPVVSSGGRVERAEILPSYLEAMQKITPNLNGLRVIVDCANGVSSLVAVPLWHFSGAQVSFMFDKVDGRFPNHAPNPARMASLAALQNAVCKQEVDLGVAYDGDGDRVAFVDAQAIPVPNDKVIVLFVHRALKHGPAPVVYDQKCSQIVREAVLEAGGKPIMERSGHTFIKTTFLKKNAPYAGELSGHHFFREIKGDDGLMASLFMGEIVCRSDKSLATLVQEIPAYPITPDIRLPMETRMVERVIRDLKRGLAGEASLFTLDGLRAEFTDGWGIARPSVTEQAITLRFEGKNQQSLLRIIHRFEEVSADLAVRLPSDVDDWE